MLSRLKFGLVGLLLTGGVCALAVDREGALNPELPRGYGISPFGFPDVLDDEEEIESAMANFLEQLLRLPEPVLMWNGAWRIDQDEGSDSGEIPGQ